MDSLQVPYGTRRFPRHTRRKVSPKSSFFFFMSSCPTPFSQFVFCIHMQRTRISHSPTGSKLIILQVLIEYPTNKRNEVKLEFPDTTSSQITSIISEVKNWNQSQLSRFGGLKRVSLESIQ